MSMRKKPGVEEEAEQKREMASLPPRPAPGETVETVDNIMGLEVCPTRDARIPWIGVRESPSMTIPASKLTVLAYNDSERKFDVVKRGPKFMRVYDPVLRGAMKAGGDK